MTEDLEKNLKKKKVTDPFVYYVLNCCLHAQSKALQNAVEEIFGEGGLGIVSFMQLLHTCWSLQESLGEAFKETWVKINPSIPLPYMTDVYGAPWWGEDQEQERRDQESEEQKSESQGSSIDTSDVGTVQKPLITRWWHVNICAAQILRSLLGWINIFSYCFRMSSSREKQELHTISKNGYALTTNKKLRSDLIFFCAFNKAYWAKNTKWMHRIDEQTKLHGHSAHHVPYRVCLMHKGLDDLMQAEDGWRTHDDFAYFIKELDCLSNEEKQNALSQGEGFMKIYSFYFDKHYFRYQTKVLPFAIAGTCQSATAFARWYLGRDETENAETLDCPVHEQRVNMGQWREYLDGLDTDPTSLDDPILNRNAAGIEYIADGNSMWDDAASDAAKKLRLDCCQYFFIHKHQTQSTEAGVQDISICSSTGRAEDDASALSSVRSMDVAPVNRNFLESSTKRKKSGNQHMGSGVGDERELRSKGSKRRKSNNQTSKPHLQSTKDRTIMLVDRAIEVVPSEDQVKRAKGTIKLKVEGNIDTASSMRSNQLMQWQNEREAKVAQRIAKNLPVPDISKIEPAEAYVPDKLKGSMDLKKMKKTKYYLKVKQELKERGYTDAQVDTLPNVTAAVNLLTEWAMQQQDWREGEPYVYTFLTGHPDQEDYM